MSSWARILEFDRTVSDLRFFVLKKIKKETHSQSNSFRMRYTEREQGEGFLVNEHIYI